MIDTSGRNEFTQNSVSWLSGGGDHLPDEVQDVWILTERYVEGLLETLPDGIEFSAGLRKLLEAKDCFIRHALKSRGVV